MGWIIAIVALSVVMAVMTIAAVAASTIELPALTIADRLIALFAPGMFTAAMPRLSASDQRIALTLIRQLALGAPDGASQLASADEPAEAQITNSLGDGALDDATKRNLS